MAGVDQYLPDLFSNSLLAAFLQRKAAAADQSGFGDTGVMAPAQARQSMPGAPGMPIGLLSVAAPMQAPPGFDALDSGPIPADEAGAAADARNVAAGRVARSVKRPAAPFTGEPVPYVDAVAGLLSGDKPPTNDPMSREPVIDPPLPRSRPDNLGAGGEDAQASAAPGAPLSLSPRDYRQQDQLPPNAAPAQGQAPAAVAGPPILDKIFDPNKAATMLALGSGFAGAGSIGIGMRRAFGAAVPALAADRAQIQKQQTISDTFRALRSAGATPAEALAASQNPEIMKTIAGKYFDDQRVPHEIGTDEFGNKIMGSFNKRTGKFYDAAGREIGANSDGSSPGSGGVNLPGGLSQIPKAYGDDGRDEGFMKAMEAQNPILASEVQALVEGRSSATGRNLQKLKPLAARYEKDWTEQTYQARDSLEKSYRGGGEGFRQLRAANTAITHGVPLLKAVEDLRNFDTLPMLNKPTGMIAGQFSKRYQEARKTFEANAEPFVRELDFALTGKSTVSGQAEIRKLLDEYASGVENKASIIRLMTLLKGRIDEHESAYSAGRKNTKLPLEALSAHNRDLLDGIVTGNSRPPAADAAAAPGAPGGPRTTSTGIKWSF